MSNTCRDLLQSIRGLGVSLAIDDFGTGFSSLIMLKHFPINTLKIDPAFIKDLPRAANDVAIMKAIITMAQSLELNVTAEGVENTERRDFLGALECDGVQGFLYSRPLPAEKNTAGTVVLARG